MHAAKTWTSACTTRLLIKVPAKKPWMLVFWLKLNSLSELLQDIIKHEEDKFMACRKEAGDKAPVQALETDTAQPSLARRYNHGLNLWPLKWCSIKRCKSKPNTLSRFYIHRRHNAGLPLKSRENELPGEHRGACWLAINHVCECLMAFTALCLWMCA